ncbi:MAG: Txe/YoeB family addiction module toxin [Lachnospiraceae bacterium]|jgi:toxin YoeB|nr:Txe/YoeB family addiction module toxin [Lachnospiraceae bacterium]
MIKYWSDIAWEEYLYWQNTDKKIIKRINTLLVDIDRNGYDGIGKPEPLKHEFSGYWSRRITDEHRLVYKIENDIIKIIQCKGHYN